MNNSRNPNDKEVGVVGQISEPTVLNALNLARTGRVYDLDSKRWHHMPVAPEHPSFEILSYRTPLGLKNQGDVKWLTKDNEANLSVLSDIVIGGTHTGTHLDALSHVCCGPNEEWFGGYNAKQHIGDFGPLKSDASTIPPIITRGILIDIAGFQEVRALPSGYTITFDDIEGAIAKQGIEINRYDAVMIRTGYMSLWPDIDKSKAHAGAGIGLDTALILAELGIALAGSDTEGFERHPSADPKNPLPVHTEFLVKRGIHIMELVNLESLAEDRVYEFCFICLPLPICGATGSMARPIALV